jgi:hypothetical protein
MLVSNQSADPYGSEERNRKVWGQSPEVSQKLRRRTVTHVLDHEEPTMTLCWGGGKSLGEHGSKGCARIPLGWGGDNVVYLFGVPVVKLRYDMVEFSSLGSDAGRPEQIELRLVRTKRRASLARTAGGVLLLLIFLRTSSRSWPYHVGVTNVVPK